VASLGQFQTLTQTQTLSPQMQQSLQLLQAPALELQNLVQQHIEMNPVLEEAPDEPAPETDDVSEPGEEAGDWDAELEELARQNEEWKEYFAQSYTAGSTPYSAEDAERRQFLFDSQVEAPSLSDHLSRQLGFATDDFDLISAGDEIIGNLDIDGYLKASLEEISLASGVDLQKVVEALELIQSFDPVGVGARDLRECLLLQLRRLGKAEDVEGLIVSRFMNELGRKKYQDIARALKTPADRIQQAAAFLSTLQPRPACGFSSDTKMNVVQAELAVVREGDEWLVVLNEDPVPRLRISDTYKDLLATNGADPSLRDYLKDKIRSGKFLIKCLHQRQQTIYNIAVEIVKRQREFFEQGSAHLKPLTMNQVAEVVGVHETTVSRAISNKYVQTPWGLFDLKYFFTPGYQTASGEVISNTSVKESIEDLIKREDPRKPLSDQEIVKILSEKGIPLARRTVAKYRAELGVLPSNLRKTS
jgi:RNA polymerase sigma-54 factor